MALSGATLALLARAPAAASGARPLARRPAVSVALVVVGLPLALWRHERAVDVGLSTQSLGPWLGDVAKSAGIGAVFAALGGALVIWLIRRFPARWWIPSAGVVVGFAVLTLYLSPVLIDPLFNKFEPLPRGELRSDVLRAGRSRRGRRGGGLPRGRQPPHHLRQRLRGRARATPSGSCSTTT